jgi:hypothetical protein
VSPVRPLCLRIVCTSTKAARDAVIWPQGGTLPTSDISPLGTETCFDIDVATEVASDVVSHQIWGPRKKSWGLPMTILAGIMRNAGRHSNLVDIVRLSPFFWPFRPEMFLYLGYHPDDPGTWRPCTFTTRCARYPCHIPST